MEAVGGTMAPWAAPPVAVGRPAAATAQESGLRCVATGLCGHRRGPVPQQSRSEHFSTLLERHQAYSSGAWGH